MGLASKLVLAYGVQQGAGVINQLAQNKPSPYPPAGQQQQQQQQQGYNGAPQQGQAAQYYQQQQPHQQSQANYTPGYGAAPSQGYNPAYAAAGGAALGAAYAAHGAHAQPQLTGDQNYILRVLEHCVQDQRLQAFYPPGSLQGLAQRISQSGALQRIAAEWRLPMEVAMDLAKLALFDVILFLDDSGSMAFEENGGRIDDAKLICSRVAQAASLFDTDGISVLFMNSHTVGHNICSEQQASQLISSINFSGLTPFGTSLDQKVLQPLIVGPARSNALRKPILVIGVTDGEPAGEDRYTLVKAVQNCKAMLQQTRYGPDALSLELAQVGLDMKSRAFLSEIDSHPVIGGMVDVTSSFEVEQEECIKTTGVSISPELWLLKLILGGISSDMDSKDERR
ncbi:hypothetical protein JCM11641_005007 [Rhodosporidiobolus odoratus]